MLELVLGVVGEFGGGGWAGEGDDAAGDEDGVERGVAEEGEGATVRGGASW